MQSFGDPGVSRVNKSPASMLSQLNREGKSRQPPSGMAGKPQRTQLGQSLLFPGNEGFLRSNFWIYNKINNEEKMNKTGDSFISTGK
jgi:hypothetical protein